MFIHNIIIILLIFRIDNIVYKIIIIRVGSGHKYITHLNSSAIYMHNNLIYIMVHNLWKRIINL